MEPVARARRAASLASFVLKCVGVAACFLTAGVIIWLVDRVRPGSADLVGDEIELRGVIVFALGFAAGSIIAALFWRLAALVRRGSRRAGWLLLGGSATFLCGVLVALATGWIGGLLLASLLLPATAVLTRTALIVLRPPRPPAGPVWEQEPTEWQRRRYRRRTLGLGLGALLGTLFIGVPLFSIGFMIGLGPGAAVAGVLTMFAVIATVRASRRWLIQGVAGVTAADPRPPVLYLRSFAADRAQIDTGYTRHAGHAGSAPLEEVVAETLWNYGPVVAAAEPGATLPPLGAARAELPANGWQEKLEEWITTAQLIAVGVGAGAGLLWELGRIAELRAADRVLFVVPPIQRSRIPGLRYSTAEKLRSDWAALCRHVDAAGAMRLPADVDLARVFVVVPGVRDAARVYVADHDRDFEYEAALDVAIAGLRENRGRASA